MTVTVATPILPNHPFSQLALFIAIFRIEVTKNDDFINTGNTDDGSVQIFLKLVFDLIWVRHGECIGAENGDRLLHIRKKKLHFHKVLCHSFQGASEFTNMRCLHRKLVFSLASFSRSICAPEEGVACASFTLQSINQSIKFI